MKHIFFFVALTLIVLFGINNKTSKELQAYKAYYEATEAFLDTLERDFNWVDGYDSEDYYEAVENLKR